MRSRKKKSMEQLTSALMAVLMAVTTTMSPVVTLADEVETSAYETTAEESTAAASSETEVQIQTSAGITASSEETSVVTEQTSAQTEALPTQETKAPEETTTAATTAPNDSSGETTTQSSANETRGPDEETAQPTSEAQTEKETMSGEVETPETQTPAETQEEASTEVETESEETSTEEETKEDPFASLDPTSGLTEEELSKIDFSSKRLLLSADESVIIDPEDVLSSYSGVYLLQYDTETQTKYAYAYYYNKSEFVDVDTVISVADGDNSANAAEPMAAEENPIAELQAAVSENPVHASGAVAVIDTGVNDVANVTESVSMIGDNTTDENGHGTKMANLIVEQNPDVSILSIKALGADGTGDVSAVYAAIRYAIDKKVSVINLSMSAVSTAENAALTSIIDEATKAGIAVVGAAGNKGMDVRFFVPGNIESAYIIGAADEDGKKLATSNYGDTVDFNVVADSTSEATAKFSGYYTLNGAVADEKLVFPTDYVKEDEVDFNGPILLHQISFYDYTKTQDDLVYISQKQMKTVLDDDYITTYIGFAEDAAAVHQLDVYVDFMSIDSETKITDECIVDLEKMLVKIPASYKDSDLTVRWFMPNASYQYGYDVNANYMISNTPEKFKISWKVPNDDGSVNFDTAWNYVQGTYSTDFTHTPESMNHTYVNYSTDGIKAQDVFTIQAGYIASVEDAYPGTYTTRSEIYSMFGANALKRWAKTSTGSWYKTDMTKQAFLTHFTTVTRDSDGADVSSWFNTVGGKGEGIIRVDTDNKYTVPDPVNNPDRKVYDTETVSASIGWVFGGCANDEIKHSCPFFQAGGKIICTNKDPDGTAYFFYYCRSERAQWSGGTFSITPPKTGYLRIHKSSSNPAMTNGNSCYKLDWCEYSIYSDAACTQLVAENWLDKNGYSQAVELNPGTYYIKETATENSGYKLDTTVHSVTVTAGTTATAPQTWETTDEPLNDPAGIWLQKTSANTNITADLSGAQYTINYYAGKYTSVGSLPSTPTTTWVIQTIKNANGQYIASLDDDHIVPNSNSASAVYGKTGKVYKIPLGTVTIQETKAPTGFTSKGSVVTNMKTKTVISGTNEVYLFNLVDENSGVSLKYSNELDTTLDTEGWAISFTYAEQVKGGGIELKKADSLSHGSATMGASLAGIVFSITNMSGHALTNYAGNTIKHGQVMQIITTDGNGGAWTGAYDLPVGTYEIQERRRGSTFDGKTFTDGTSDYANWYYEWDGSNKKTITITEDNVGTWVWVDTFEDKLANGGIQLYKYDKTTGGKPSGSVATLAGIQFAIINNNDWEVLNNYGKWIDKGGVVQVITTDANGYAATGTYDIPVGNYIVKEISMASTYDGSTGTYTEKKSDYANDFYFLSDENVANVEVKMSQIGTLVWAGTFTDQLAMGGLSVQKYDKTTGGKPNGSVASLAGIKFAIFNNNTWDVKNKDGYLIKPGKVVQIIETDENGGAWTGKYDLQVGSYMVREVRMSATFDGSYFNEYTSDYANDFYYFDENNKVYVDILPENVETIVKAGTFYNQVAMGGLSIQKTDKTSGGNPQGQAELGGVRFAIFNKNNWNVKNKDGYSIAPGGVVQVITTDQTGKASTGKYDLQVGTYLVKEMHYDATFDGKNYAAGSSIWANDFYLWDDNNEVSVTISKNQVETIVAAGSVSNQVAAAGIELQKFDKKTGGYPGGQAELAGVKFSIINANDWAVKNYAGELIPKWGVVQIIETDANGRAATGTHDIPIGNYVVQELRDDATFDGKTFTDGTSKYANWFYYWDGNNRADVTITKDQVETYVYAGTFYDQLAAGGISVQKYDKGANGASDSQASLAGIRFAIINKNTWKVKNKDGKWIEPDGVVQVITTDKTGLAKTGATDIAVGDYQVKEIRYDATYDGKTGVFDEGTSGYANWYYYYDKTNVKDVSITEKEVETIVSAGTVYNQLAAGGISIQKYDKTTKGLPNGQASLAGISFAIINKNTWKVLNKDGKWIQPGDVVQVITTDEKGKASTGAKDIPVGTYLVKEIRYGSTYKNGVFTSTNSEYSNYFYLYDDANEAAVSITKDQVETIVSAGTFYDQFAAGGISVQKYDSITQKKAVAGASLAGIQFGIFNANTWDVINYAGETIPQWGCVQVIETDETGIAKTGIIDIPAGDYIVRELRKDATFDGKNFAEGSSDYANDSYWWSDQRDSVHIDAFTASETYVWAKTFFDQPIYGARGDFKLVKKNGETGTTLSYIPFKITNTKTGETHYILTGSDGSFNSSAKKTTHTNGNDSVLSKYTESDVIPQSVINTLLKDAGLWFTNSGDGQSSVSTANNAYGALTFGSYTITELKTEATAGMMMYTGSFTIESGETVLDLGTINNASISIKTTLADSKGSHSVTATASVTLIDKVAYSNLDPTKTYTLTGNLYLKGENELTLLTTKTVSFKPTAADGTQNVTFTFDASELKGKSVVAFEELFVGDTFVAEHKDRDDEEQTVSFPLIRESAELTLKKTNGQTGEALSGIPFRITNVKTGETHYIVTGSDGSFSSATNQKSVQTNANDAVLSKYSDTDVIPQSVISSLKKDAGLWFETDSDKTIAKVDDTKGSFVFGDYTITELKTEATKNMRMYTGTFTISTDTVLDLGTIKNVPVGMKTTLADASGSKTIEAAKSVTLIDHVAYTGLDTTKTYLLTGTLYVKSSTGLTELTTAKVSFTPSKSDGTQDVTFTFDASELTGKTVVAFEELTQNKAFVAEHKDANDTDQTVSFPDLHSSGDFKFVKKNGETGAVLSGIPFKLTNTETGETHYLVTGSDGSFDSSIAKSRNTNANDAVLSKYGDSDVIPQSVINSLKTDAGLWFEKEGSETRTVNESLGALPYGTYTMTELKTEATKTMTMVTKTVTIETDDAVLDLGVIENVSVGLGTTLTTNAGSHYAAADATVTLTDTVSYENLPIGKRYTLTGTLYAKDGTTLTKVAEQTISFEPKTASGSVAITFRDLKTTGLKGKSLVCYEELSLDGTFVAEHKNPDDEGQTVHFPSVKTTATASDTNDHIVQAKKQVTIVDTVTVDSIIVGESYTLRGVLMDRATQKPLLVSGKQVTVTKTFTATDSSMQVPLTFTMDASALEGTTTVVYETLLSGTVEIASHKEINDEGQTVYLPKLKTTATELASNSHQAAPVTNTTIVDAVEYTNLIPKKTYTITGKLMNKTTGQVVNVNGKEVTATTTFTASESGSGKEELRFVFDATGLTGSYVVFETLYYNDVLVGAHADLEDEDQTVRFSKLTVLKLSTDDKDVVGAKLEIRNADGDVLESFETKENGTIFYRLAFDTEYTLVETDAPDGYLPADPITFVLKENGKVLVDGKEQDSLVMVDDYATGTLEITKRSLVSNKLLPNAVYGVYSDETCNTLVETLTTDENGKASVVLNLGTYWVRELKSPTGYRFDSKVYGPYEITSTQRQVSDTLYDKPLTPVPTGIHVTLWPYLILLGVGLLLFGIFSKKPKKK